MMTLICLLILIQLMFIHSRDIPATLNFAFLSGKTLNGAFDRNGVQSLQAMIMALQELNNKTDGVYDDILPNTQLRFVSREPKTLFTVDVINAQYVATEAFNNEGVIAAIGPASYSGTAVITATAMLFNQFNVLQISHGAYYSQLDYGSTYKHLLRTVPSESAEGHALADIVYNEFKWNQFFIFYGLDARSSNTANIFQEKVKVFGANILGREQFAPGETDFTDEINNAANTGAQIFTLFTTYEDAAVLIHQAHHAGLFKEGTQILAISSLNTYLLAKTLMAMNNHDEVIVKSMLRGLITLKYVVNGAASDERKDFVKRWRSQPSTAGYRTANGTLICDQTTDMDTYATGSNVYYLYQDFTNSSESSKICAGFDYAADFKEDGSNVVSPALYAYDAVHTMARGLHHLLYDTSLPLTASNLKMTIIQNVSFQGVTGNISYSPGWYGELRIGEGNRYNGIKYEVYNFNPDYFDSLDSNYTGFVYVGTWETQQGFRTCADEADRVCYNQVFDTADSVTAPLDAPKPIYVRMDPSMKYMMYFISSLCMAISFLCAIALIVYKDSKVMKASQPVLLCFILIGAFFSGARSLVSSFDVSVTSCVSSMWTGHLAFLLTFMAIIAKSYRIHLLVNAKAFKRVKVTMSSVLKVYSGILILTVAFLLLIMYVGQQYVHVSVTKSKLQYTYAYKCQDHQPACQNTLFLIEGIVLLIGSYLSYSTRDAPDVINESTYIGLVTILISFIAMVTFPAVMILNLPFVIQQMLEGIVFGICGIMVVTILFIPKIFMLVAKGDIKMDMKLYKNIKRAQRVINGPSNINSNSNGNNSLSASGGTVSMSKTRNTAIVPMLSRYEGIASSGNQPLGDTPDVSSGNVNTSDLRVSYEKQIQECFEQAKLWKEKKVMLQQMYELLESNMSQMGDNYASQSRSHAHHSSVIPGGQDPVDIKKNINPNWYSLFYQKKSAVYHTNGLEPIDSEGV